MMCPEVEVLDPKAMPPHMPMFLAVIIASSGPRCVLRRYLQDARRKKSAGEGIRTPDLDGVWTSFWPIDAILRLRFLV